MSPDRDRSHPPVRAAKPRPAHLRLGTVGEDLAADHLRRDGMRVIERNWRCEAGELDIVANDRGVIVFCEVKTRRSLRYGTPMQAIDDAKAERIRRLAAIWQRRRRTPPTADRNHTRRLGSADARTASAQRLRGCGGRTRTASVRRALGSGDRPRGSQPRDLPRLRRAALSASTTPRRRRESSPSAPGERRLMALTGRCRPGHSGRGDRRPTAGFESGTLRRRIGWWDRFEQRVRPMTATLSTALRRGGSPRSRPYARARRFDVVCVVVRPDGLAAIDHRRGAL